MGNYYDDDAIYDRWNDQAEREDLQNQKIDTAERLKSFETDIYKIYSEDKNNVTYTVWHDDDTPQDILHLDVSDYVSNDSEIERYLDKKFTFKTEDDYKIISKRLNPDVPKESVEQRFSDLMDGLKQKAQGMTQTQGRKI